MNLINSNVPYLKGKGYILNPEELEPFFISPLDHLELMEIGGYFTPVPSRKESPAILFDYLKNIGFSLIWKLKGPNGERGPTMVSVGRRLAMNHFTLSETLGDVSIGSCVSGEKAFQIIKDFAENPNVLSGAVDWVDIMTLQWPEP